MRKHNHQIVEVSPDGESERGRERSDKSQHNCGSGSARCAQYSGLFFPFLLLSAVVSCYGRSRSGNEWTSHKYDYICEKCDSGHTLVFLDLAALPPAVEKAFADTGLSVWNLTPSMDHQQSQSCENFACRTVSKNSKRFSSK